MRKARDTIGSYSYAAYHWLLVYLKSYALLFFLTRHNAMSCVLKGYFPEYRSTFTEKVVVLLVVVLFAKALQHILNYLCN